MKKYNVIVIFNKNLTETLMCNFAFDKTIEVYYGILNKDVELIEEVNKLEWIDINDNFFDMNKYAGEGNIGHIIEEIKISLN